jgi:hypothetical protein
MIWWDHYLRRSGVLQEAERSFDRSASFFGSVFSPTIRLFGGHFTRPRIVFPFPKLLKKNVFAIVSEPGPPAGSVSICPYNSRNTKNGPNLVYFLRLSPAK